MSDVTQRPDVIPSPVFDDNPHAFAAALELGKMLPLRKPRPDEQIAISPVKEVPPAVQEVSVEQAQPVPPEATVLAVTVAPLIDLTRPVESVREVLERLARELAPLSNVATTVVDLHEAVRTAQMWRRLMATLLYTCQELEAEISE